MGNRDSNGRFRPVGLNAGVNTVSGRDELQAKIAADQEASKSSERVRLESAVKNEVEHEQLQESGKDFLRSVGPAYSALQDQMSDKLYQWFHHQGFWPEWWHPNKASSMQFRHEHPGEDSETVTIHLSEYIRLKKMEKLGLVVTEVAECMEAVRKDDHENEREELADIDIRLHDYKGGFGMTELNCGFVSQTAVDSFIGKMLNNFARPFRHGKKF